MKILKNYLYNLTYQIVLIIVPVITIPYVAKVLGTEGIGIYSFSESIIQYFILFGTFGQTLYASRQTAYVRDDFEQLSKTFWEIFWLKFSFTIISLIIYLVFLAFSGISNKYIFLLQTINLLGFAFDISWLFIGMEDFKKLALRGVSIKVIGLIFIFLLVKTTGDLWKYALILIFINVLSNLILWMYVLGHVKFIKINIKGILSHIKPAAPLFLTRIMIFSYAFLDKIILGTLSSFTQLGLYDISIKILSIITPLVTSLSTVMLPRIANIYSTGNEEQIKKYTVLSLKFMLFLAFPLVATLIAMSDNIVKWLFSEEFQHLSLLIKITAPAILFLVLGNIFGIQVLVPIKKEKDFNISIALGAVTSIGFNFLLIPKYGAVGACISFLICQMAVSGYQFIIAKKYVIDDEHPIELWKYCVGAVSVFFVLIQIDKLVLGHFYIFIIQIITAFLTYIFVMIFLKSETILFLFSKAKIIFMKNNIEDFNNEYIEN